MFRLQCKSQNYAWGKPSSESLVAQLLTCAQQQINPQDRFAELWMGTHRSAPSVIAERLGISGDKQEQKQDQEDNATNKKSLKDLLTATNPNIISANHTSIFGENHHDLPYLFKVLSIDKALSIQAHPDKKLAEKLHREDPEHYPDDNHKPELVVALTPFQALCCFRKTSEIVWFLKKLPELSQVTGFVQASSTMRLEDDDNCAAEFIRPLLSKLYKTPQEENVALQEQLLERIIRSEENQQQDSSTANDDDEKKMQALLTRAFAAFRQISSQFPGDIGLWMVFFLNVLDLQPGDGLFLAANEPHAYLAGDCVEIMAASDNVIRAGLTPKFKDVEALLSSLTYRTNSLQYSMFKSDFKLPVQGYIPPSIIPEFRLDRITCRKQQQLVQEQQQQAPVNSPTMSPKPSKIRIPLHSTSIFIVLQSDTTQKSKELARVSRIVTEDDGRPVSTESSYISKGEVDAVVLEEQSTRHTYVEFENLSSEEDLVCYVAQTRGDGHALLTKF